MSQTITRDPFGTPVSVTDAQGHSALLATDHLGSPFVEFDGDGQLITTRAHEPYGNMRSGLPGTIGYAGGSHDTTTGLTQFGARYYDPTLGTFTQADPSGLEDNPYQYALFNPINYTDPTGLTGCSEIVGLTGLAYAAMWSAIIGSGDPALSQGSHTG